MVLVLVWFWFWFFMFWFWCFWFWFTKCFYQILFRFVFIVANISKLVVLLILAHEMINLSSLYLPNKFLFYIIKKIFNNNWVTRAGIIYFCFALINGCKIFIVIMFVQWFSWKLLVCILLTCDDFLYILLVCDDFYENSYFLT